MVDPLSPRSGAGRWLSPCSHGLCHGLISAALRAGKEHVSASPSGLERSRGSRRHLGAARPDLLAALVLAQAAGVTPLVRLAGRFSSARLQAGNPTRIGQTVGRAGPWRWLAKAWHGMVRLLPRRREALNELTEGGDEGGDTVAEFLFGGFGAFAFSADGVLGVGDLEGEGGNGDAVLVDLALSVAPKLAAI